MTGQDSPTQRGVQRLRGLGRGQLFAIAAAMVGVVVILARSVIPAGGTGRHAQPAPAKNFTLVALGHPGQVSLRSLAGQPVIVNFFASWCGPCQRETPLLASFYRSTHGRVALIGIDVNDRASSALAFMRKSGVTYPVGTEPASESTVIAYGLPGLPATFFLDARHRIVKRVYGAVTRAELTSGAALINPRAK